MGRVPREAEGDETAPPSRNGSPLPFLAGWIPGRKRPVGMVRWGRGRRRRRRRPKKLVSGGGRGGADREKINLKLFLPEQWYDNKKDDSKMEKLGAF